MHIPSLVYPLSARQGWEIANVNQDMNFIFMSLVQHHGEALQPLSSILSWNHRHLKLRTAAKAGGRFAPFEHQHGRRNSLTADVR